jgi:hypothetical protein
MRGRDAGVNGHDVFSKDRDVCRKRAQPLSLTSAAPKCGHDDRLGDLDLRAARS